MVKFFKAESLETKIPKKILESRKSSLENLRKSKLTSGKILGLKIRTGKFWKAKILYQKNLESQNVKQKILER